MDLGDQGAYSPSLPCKNRSRKGWAEFEKIFSYRTFFEYLKSLKFPLFSFTKTMLGKWVFGEAMCPTVLFLQITSVGVSIFTNTAIGCDR